MLSYFTKLLSWVVSIMLGESVDSSPEPAVKQDMSRRPLPPIPVQSQTFGSFPISPPSGNQYVFGRGSNVSTDQHIYDEPTYNTAYDHLRQQAPAFGFRKTQNACPPQGPNGPLPKVSPQPRNKYSDNLEIDNLFLRRQKTKKFVVLTPLRAMSWNNTKSSVPSQRNAGLMLSQMVNEMMKLHLLTTRLLTNQNRLCSISAEQVILPTKMEPSHMPWQRNESTPPPRRSSAARTDIDHAVYGTPNLNRNQGNQANNQQARGPPQNETESTTSAERMHPSRPVPSQKNEPAAMSVSSFCGTSRSHVTVESEIGHANPNTYAVPNGKRNDGNRIFHNQTLTKTDQDRPAYETPLSGQMQQGPMSSPRNGLNSAAMPPPPPCGAYGAQSAP
ncbi:hypothetical protein OUZ56_014780 [Daphnia magna]|uniref:Uncharacterized protein n=1 Tax=Daphnia magna TaxID=35525 RepID=A0ABR0AKT3_9CRUS|nr:hypothetical protein OUZ56_014780 [Daphnia magna]